MKSSFSLIVSLPEYRFGRLSNALHRRAFVAPALFQRLKQYDYITPAGRFQDFGMGSLKQPEILHAFFQIGRAGLSFTTFLLERWRTQKGFTTDLPLDV